MPEEKVDERPPTPKLPPGKKPDESGTPAAAPERQPKVKGPSVWMVLATVAAIAGLVWFYQSTLGDLASAIAAPIYGALPRLILAAGIVFAAVLLAGLARVAVRYGVPEGRRRNTIGALTRYTIYILAAFAALSTIAPGQLDSLVVSLGLLGFGITLALQKPIMGVVAWLTINLQGLYVVGDRIAVGDVRGDVLHVGLLTTVMWEVEGELGRPTGRRVSFGNQMVLEEPLVNYSADLPYNWSQVEVPVAKEGDWELAKAILLRVADEVVGNERMGRRVREYERLMAGHRLRYDLPDHPTVTMKLADDHSYLVVRLRYLVHLDEQSKTRTELLERIYAEFRKHPRRLPMVYARNQQMAIDRYGMPANAWGPEDQEPAREPEEGPREVATRPR